MSKTVAVRASGVSKGGLMKSADGTGYAVDWTELPASDHFFLATDCKVKRDGLGLKLLFGSVSAFETDPERFDLAVEIHFPINEGSLYLYKSVCQEVSGNGQSSFYDSVKAALVKLGGTTEVQSRNLGLPSNKSSSFRIFPANFASWSFSGTQGLIEFFEVPPELIHLFLKKNKVRPGGGVKPVISIVMDTATMTSCIDECRRFLETYQLGGSNE